MKDCMNKVNYFKSSYGYAYVNPYIYPSDVKVLFINFYLSPRYRHYKPHYLQIRGFRKVMSFYWDPDEESPILPTDDYHEDDYLQMNEYGITFEKLEEIGERTDWKKLYRSKVKGADGNG